MTIEVTREVLEALCNAAVAAYPDEACGILQGEGARIIRFTEARNVHPAPASHFEVDPQTLINAHRAARSGGLQVLGYFHSHPSGPANPSKTDQHSAPGDGKIWAIHGGRDNGGGNILFWRDQPSGFQSLSYQLVEG